MEIRKQLDEIIKLKWTRSWTKTQLERQLNRLQKMSERLEQKGSFEADNLEDIIAQLTLVSEYLGDEE